jgi:ribulose-phosphate 3-epimerase
MAEIIPAILAKNFKDLDAGLVRLTGLVPMVQVDIADGKFVPNTTWPYGKGGEAEFDSIKHQEEGFPHWHDFDFEFDLMVAFPEEVLEDWINAGAKRVIFHAESNKNILDSILMAKDFDVEAGIAIGVGTDVRQIEELLPHVDVVQFMGIRKVGFQGQAFDPAVVRKIRSFKDEHPDCAISVDGGVNMDTAAALIEAGANRLVVGSALFGAPDIEAALQALSDLR